MLYLTTSVMTAISVLRNSISPMLVYAIFVHMLTVCSEVYRPPGFKGEKKKKRRRE